MGNTELNQLHASGDRLLGLLSRIDGVVGDFVKHYPGMGASEPATWLDDWFLSRATAFQEGSASESVKADQVSELVEEMLRQQAALVTRPMRFVSLKPHFFRGFRDLADPISLVGDLVVIDGPNSSGKTSLAESVEWLLTGALTRRSMQQYGNPRELESCISNQLRPEGEETWVEAELASATGERLKMRRILVEDYGTTQTSVPKSKLFVQGQQLDAAQEATFLGDVFAGIPPLLMQHSLRVFVHSSPSERRGYFERLLQLDELTYLIEKAVIGDPHRDDFAGPSGGVALRQWQNLKTTVRASSSRSALARVERSTPKRLGEDLACGLESVARSEFSQLVSPDTPLEQIRQMVLAEQTRARQRKFPLLGKLRPQRYLDMQLDPLLSAGTHRQAVESLDQAFRAVAAAKETSRQVSQAEAAVAGAFDVLVKAGLIAKDEVLQSCPLCDYPGGPTLSPERIHALKSWQPLQQAMREAEALWNKTAGDLHGRLSSLDKARRQLIPALPTDTEWDQSLAGLVPPVLETATSFRCSMAEISVKLQCFDEHVKNLLPVLSEPGRAANRFGEVRSRLEGLADEIGRISAMARAYSGAFADLEKAIGTLIREDPDYSLRALWLSVADNLDTVIADLLWERAKKQAQDELKSIREALLSARQSFLDSRRVDFSQGMQQVWKRLRADNYSVFSALTIPGPRGKGLPVEIEVKALLDDGTHQREVDALRVFSESQVNVLGLAAFVTRSRLVGHRALIFDDPVQSMDEDHFKTFARDLIPLLLDEGLQVIVLTHNDRFAREVSFACLDVERYATMCVRHTRRKGCQIDEGNRRIAERLKQAERKGEDGELGEAWRLVRLALERLYTVACLKHGPSGFDPFTWADQTAEHMWDAGAGVVIQERIPGSGLRLKEILDMTVGGAHDKAPHGLTDLNNAIAYVRGLLVPLRLGAG